MTTRKVVLTAVANDEVRQATAWYAERSELAATRFVADYRDTRARAVEHPTQWPELEPGIRRVLFKHFPFAVIYLTDELRITIIAVMHQRRRPGYWRTPR